MSEPKFKVGDKVVLSGNAPPIGGSALSISTTRAFLKHKEGTVISSSEPTHLEGQRLYFLTFPGYQEHQYEGGVFECELKLAGPRDYTKEDEGGVV